MSDSTKSARVAVPLPNAGAYISGDAIGGILTLAGIGLAGGILSTLDLLDAGQSGLVDIVLFSEAPATPIVDNAPFSLAAGAVERSKVLTILTFATAYTALGSGNGLTRVTTGIPFQFGATPDGNLYAQLLSRDSKTYATLDLILSAGRT